MLNPSRSLRHLAPFSVSIAAHAAVVAMILYLGPRMPDRQPDWIVASLIDAGGGGSGPGVATLGRAPGDVRMELTPMPDAPPAADFSDHEVQADAANPAPEDALGLLPRPGVMAHLTASAIRTHRDGAGGMGSSGHGGVSPGTGGGEGGGSGSGNGSGVGSGSGDGLQVAHADYGANPFPPYPSGSRRRSEQGTVILHVLIAPDGSVEQVEIAQSSGFEDLDRSALETVRSQWRFVPAHRGDGHALESWVLLPIRFALR